ncbi:hypothetical protein [Oceanivirga salmonicida]|uniref:hypothetical protein n=1 Tax=Oceanivirga salmonicida TaxID=1769291 RepID=UPI00082F0A2D|nr:hypothetical protein [Oceanivirga salmonicida]
MKKILMALVLMSGIFAFSISIYDGGATKYTNVDIEELLDILENHSDKIDKKRKGNDLYILTKDEKEELDNILLETNEKIIKLVEEDLEEHEIDEIKKELNLFRIKLKKAKTIKDYEEIEYIIENNLDKLN